MISAIISSVRMRSAVAMVCRSIDALPIQLRGNDVQASQHRHDVAQRVPADQVREQREVDERRRPAAGAVGHVAAVADDVEPQFAVGRFDRRVRLLRCGTSKPRLVITSSKCVISPFDASDRPAAWSGSVVRSSTPTLTGPAGRFSIACSTIFRLSRISAIRTQVAGEAVAGRRAADLEIEIGVRQVRLVLAQVARHAAGPGDRARWRCS